MQVSCDCGRKSIPELRNSTFRDRGSIREQELLGNGKKSGASTPFGPPPSAAFSGALAGS